MKFKDKLNLALLDLSFHLPMIAYGTTLAAVCITLIFGLLYNFVLWRPITGMELRLILLIIVFHLLAYKWIDIRYTKDNNV